MARAAGDLLALEEPVAELAEVVEVGEEVEPGREPTLAGELDVGGKRVEAEVGHDDLAGVCVDEEIADNEAIEVAQGGAVEPRDDGAFEGERGRRA